MPTSVPRFACAPLVAVALLCALGCGAAQRPTRQPAPPPTAEQLLEIAAVLEARGDALRAGQYLSLALAHGAHEARVVPRLLRLYVRDGQYRLAAERAENYLRRHPRDVHTRFVLANLYAGLAQPDHAAAQYRLVLAAAPARADAHFALAALLREQGHDLVEADRHYRAYLQLMPAGAHAEEARAALLQDVP